MTPVAAANAHQRWGDEPRAEEDRNSPTKPFKPGSPIEESVAIRKSVVVTGTTAAMPP